MRFLLVEPSSQSPVSPLFGDAVHDMATQDVGVACIKEGTLAAGFGHLPLNRVILRTMRPFLERLANQEVRRAAAAFGPTHVLVVKGATLTPSTVRYMRQLGACVWCFSTDDPFSSSARQNIRDAIPEYDLHFTPRAANIDDLLRAGAKRVEYVRFGYKPRVHFVDGEAETSRRWECDVAFIGGADAERARSVQELQRQLSTLTFKLYGGYWRRFPLMGACVEPPVYGQDYRAAIRSAKVVVNLVRASNRDDHVMRTFELPACGSCTVAEDTPQHRVLRDEGNPAVLFRTSSECADAVRRLVSAPNLRERHRLNAADFIRTTKHSYHDRLREFLLLGESTRSPERGCGLGE